MHMKKSGNRQAQSEHSKPDEILWRMLNTPPQPHAQKVKKQAKKKQAKKRPK
jgi:hypothetical protein